MDEQPQVYTVLARRFRPATFSEVVGQQHIAQSLQNAIAGGRVAHAYLFTGARGVGKTSTARILAKTLNCPNVVDGVPCNTCEICQGIAAGNDVDVLEIDGASNRGIDDVRQLRANVSVRSMRTKYKIYIIDEVHMLTKEAFNALLKTLEEPPPNVKFVFCTTEPTKVPDTILSRCQRFDFSTIDTASIADRLRQIAAVEGFQVDEDAVELVARRAAGSMRDSQSLFDQILAFGQEHVTAADVHRLIGTAPDDRLIEIMDGVIDRRPDLVLESLEQTLASGVRLGEFVEQLLHYLRDLVVLSARADGVGLTSASENSRTQLSAQAERCGIETLVAAMQILAEARSRMSRATYGRAIAELALVRLTMLEDLRGIDALLTAVRSGTGIAPHPGAGRSGGEPVGGPTANRAPARLSMPSSGRGAGREVPPAAEPEKKTSDSGSNGNLAHSEADASTPQIEVAAGNEAELLKQLVSSVDDKLRMHIGSARRIAILGPNHLEVLFPKSYDFSRRCCEKGDAAAKLSAAARRLTGKAVNLAFRLDDEDQTSKGVTTAPQRATTIRLDEPVADELVNQALAVFKGSLVEVRETKESVPRDGGEE